MALSLSPQLQVLVVDEAINFVAAVVILFVGWTVAGWAARGVRSGLRRIPTFDATLRPLLASAVRYLIVILTIIAVLQRFGVDTTSLIALLGAAGLALGLAMQGTLSNVAASVGTFQGAQIATAGGATRFLQRKHDEHRRSGLVPAAGFSATKDDVVKRVQMALNQAGIRFAQPLRTQQPTPPKAGDF